MAKRLSDLPITKTIEIPFKEPYREVFGDSLVLTVVATNHPGYPEDSVTLMSKKIIQFMPIDANEPDSPVSGRNTYGNNRYTHSNWHQWANSNAPSGSWYVPQHPHDEPPSIENGIPEECAYDAMDGFLRMLPDEFVDAILETTILTQLPDSSFSKVNDTTIAKVFLPCAAELGWEESWGAVSNGVKYAIFDLCDGFSLGFVSPAAAERRYPSQSEYADSAYTWCSRTAEIKAGTSMRVSPSNGTVSTGTASYPYGIRPAMNLPASMLISSVPNQRGHYETASQSDERIDFDIVGAALDSRPREACLHIPFVGGAPESVNIMLCNNMLDMQPSWEAYTPGTTHRFINQARVSEAWAIGTRIVLGPAPSMELEMSAPVIVVKTDK